MASDVSCIRHHRRRRRRCCCYNNELVEVAHVTARCCYYNMLQLPQLLRALSASCARFSTELILMRDISLSDCWQQVCFVDQSKFFTLCFVLVSNKKLMLKFRRCFPMGF